MPSFNRAHIESSPIPRRRARSSNRWSHEGIEDRIQKLCAGFEQYVAYYDDHIPFRRKGQLEFHVSTIQRRRSHGSVAAAIRDDAFLCYLWKTLRAWGLNRPGPLVPPHEFRRGVEQHLHRFALLEPLSIESILPPDIGEQVWSLIEAVPVKYSQNKVVSGSKAFHHLLPDLVPPMDRKYTRVFFHWADSMFQNRPREAFLDLFDGYARVAQVVRPSQYVGAGWRTSPTKVLDNAVVAFCLRHNLV